MKGNLAFIFYPDTIELESVPAVSFPTFPNETQRLNYFSNINHNRKKALRLEVT